MANHGFGHIKQNLTVEEINNDLMEINFKRFNNCFIITHSKDGDNEIWWLRLGENDLDGFEIWFNLRNKNKKIEWPHTYGTSFWWLQETFISLLLSKYGGMISDEGCDGKWKPEFHTKYPHMIDWFMVGTNHIDGKIKKFFYKRIAKSSYKAEIKLLPKEILNVL